MKMRILADAHIPYLRGVAEQLGEVEYLPGDQFSREAVKERDALIVRTVTHFGEEILRGSSVKLICSATIGYDHIDTTYCDREGIAWRTAPGCNADSVAQYIIATLLFLAQKHHFNLKDKTIGVVGVGNVGSRVVAACRTLGMNLLLNDPPREEREGKGDETPFTNLATVMQEADIITFHTPLTKSAPHNTYHLADEQFFHRVSRRPYIINAARGGVIDNQALKRALQQGTIAGAVIDCWENEPAIDRELLQQVDIATPHIAGYSADGKWTATYMSLENVNNFFGLHHPLRHLEIPPPVQPVIDLKEISEEHQLMEAVWHTYHPQTESEALKQSPENFTRFRSDYPLRREFPAFQIVNAAASVTQILKGIGFNVQ